MNFTLIYLAFLIISTIYRFGRITKSYETESSPGKVYFPSSYPILLALYLLIWIGAVSEYFYLQYINPDREINLFISTIGFLIYVLTIPLRDVSAKTLGKYLSPDVKILDDHQLIKEGPYRYIRHPLALCVIVEVIGLTLIPNAYFTLLFCLLIFTPYIIWRTYLEEKALTEKFGQAYLDYKKEVSAYLPFKKE